MVFHMRSIPRPAASWGLRRQKTEPCGSSTWLFWCAGCPLSSDCSDVLDVLPRLTVLMCWTVFWCAGCPLSSVPRSCSWTGRAAVGRPVSWASSGSRPAEEWTAAVCWPELRTTPTMIEAAFYREVEATDVEVCAPDHHQVALATPTTSCVPMMSLSRSLYTQ